jgi:hypothetical protein
MVINIAPNTFGGPLRNGDMIALLNALEYIRRKNPDSKFHMMEGTINSAKYCQDLFKFLCENTDYFSSEAGQQTLPWRKVNLWDFRDISGDIAKIKNTKTTQKKIVVFPLFDAPYNTYRNWPSQLLDQILTEYNLPDYEKIICVQNELPQTYDNWKYSTDFMTNVYHIMEAEIFIGAETGSAILASALDKPPQKLIYYYSSRGLIHTLPFNVLKGQGELRTYWGDFEGTSWQ